MNPILEQIYATILPSAPYLIAAYALIWLALFVYVIIIMRGQKKAERQMSMIEEEIKERKSDQS